MTTTNAAYVRELERTIRNLKAGMRDATGLVEQAGAQLSLAPDGGHVEIYASDERGSVRVEVVR